MTYTDEYLEHYGDRFVALKLRDTGLTFEQYLAAPRAHEQSICMGRAMMARLSETAAAECRRAGGTP